MIIFIVFIVMVVIAHLTLEHVNSISLTGRDLNWKTSSIARCTLQNNESNYSAIICNMNYMIN